MILKRKYCILPFILKAKFIMPTSFHWSHSNTLQNLSACFLQLGSKINSFTFLQHGALSDFEYDYQETIRPPSVFLLLQGRSVSLSHDWCTQTVIAALWKSGSLGFYLPPSILISTLCDSLGFPSILGEAAQRRRPPIKEGGRHGEWHGGRWWETKPTNRW